MLHLSRLVLRPRQFLPPLDGGGLVHVLLLARRPKPHEAEQGLHEPQGDQRPLTFPPVKYLHNKTICIV